MFGRWHTKINDWINNTNGIQYAYNNANQLTKVTDYDGTEAVAYAYDVSGRAMSMTDTHGGVSAVTSYTYTSRGRMTSIAHKTASAGSTLESYGYTMDKAGLISRIDQVDLLSF